MRPSVSGSGAAVTARGSIAAPATREVVRRIFAVTLSGPNAPLMSPYARVLLRAMLSSMSVVDSRRGFGRRCDHVPTPSQRIELGGDLLGGVLRLVRGLGDDQRVRLAHVVDLVAVEDRPAVRDHIVGPPVAQAVRGFRAGRRRSRRRSRRASRFRELVSMAVMRA